MICICCGPRFASVFWVFSAGEIVSPSDGGYDSAVHLSYGDVRLDHATSPILLEVSIKASKTDPFRQGVTVVVGSSHSSSGLCAVSVHGDSRGHGGSLFSLLGWPFPYEG